MRLSISGCPISTGFATFADESHFHEQDDASKIGYGKRIDNRAFRSCPVGVAPSRDVDILQRCWKWQLLCYGQRDRYSRACQSCRFLG